jgi:hypothetical protein
VSKRIGVLAVIAVLAFPALAGAKIVLNQSIAGVSLGETVAQVRTHLGAPFRISRSSGLTNWLYKRRLLLVVFGGNGHVTQVFTENPSQRTPGGIGVGSSQAAVLSHIKGVQCTHVPPYAGKECVVSVAHGAAQWTTDFHVGPNKKGRIVVQSVLVNILANTGGALDRALSVRL